MKKILGLDLGTNSIGWALVNEAENENEKSSIIMLGVRVNPLTVDEQKNFEKGKSITTNADRTMKRGMRRNLQRYKLRRENLIEILKENGFITDETILSENGNYTTFETYRLRAKAVTEEITLEQFARVLLMINKKRGYKSNRKAKGAEEEGVLIDGMEVAKLLYEKDLTPGQYCLQLMEQGKKQLPDFYRSDLQEEFNRIWAKQQEFYSEILTDKLKENLREKSEKATWTICKEPFNIVGIPRTTKGEELKKENFAWRTKALSEKLDLESLAVVLQKINGQINNSSGYLGAISDRSKELYFNKQTVGQYQMTVLAQNPNASLKNMVFYRQDYLDEFNIIWEKQAEFHKKELTEELKKEIRDVIIFYQRRLKSQKGLIGFCEFESRQIEVEIDGKKKIKTVGSRVIPRSSPLFQEFKIWQTLNNLEVSGKGRKSKKKKEHSLSLFTNQEDPLLIYGKRELYQEEKELLATELSIKEKLTKSDILKLLFDNPQELDLNFKEVQGNLTQAKLFAAYRDIIEQTGHILDLKKSASEILENVEQIFSGLGYNTDIIRFNSDTDNLDNDPMYKLWHLLYSFEGDNSKTGNENLINKITSLYGFEKEYAAILANITFQDDYGSLSAKAIRKIFPYLKEGNKYDISCEYAGYRHSASSLTKEELENKIYKDRLEILPKNSLRNPVVEKILNQMVHVVNAIIADPQLGKPDEIRIELARELKKNAKERQELTKSIEESTRMHKQYREILSKPPFNLSYISRNDIIRYKLYEELKDNGYHTLYSNTYISPTTLFSGDFDV
jgi:CRISPR-associated endonuclease Csn1